MNLLIIKPSSLGDIIHGLQVAQSIKEQLPNCKIDWVVRDRFAPIVSRCQTVDNCFLFHRRKGLKSFIKLLKQIRKTHYDYCLDFQGLARTGIMTWFARATKKIGRCDAREFSRLAYHQAAKLPPSGKMSHATDVLLQFLPELGLKPQLVGQLSYTRSSLTHLDPRLDETSPSPILLIPHSRQPRKEWPYFLELTIEILNNFPNETLIWDSHHPITLPSFLAHHPNLINLTGKTGIEEMISLVASSHLVIANDSGPMHLAAAMGKETLGIFGPTPPERFGPYPPNRTTNHSIQALNGNLLMLPVDSVFRIVEKILQEKAKKNPT